MRITRHGKDGYRMALSTDDTYRWARRPGAAWLGSTLSGERCALMVDRNGLCDLTVNGRDDTDVDSNELAAIVADHLPADLRHLWPTWQT